MFNMTLSKLAKIVDGCLYGDDESFECISSDTRAIKQGDLYLAIKGESFDGHQFVDEAKKKGAVAAIVSQKNDYLMPIVVVDDTVIAYGKLAAYWRQQCKLKVVALTGSNGKTTVKEMITAILSQKQPTLSTQGNFNNEIGLPKTLMNLTEKHHFAVIEMGANHMGDIAYLSQITKPDIGLITNVGSAHLEGFGSEAGVAKTKGEIIDALSLNGIMVLNADDKYFSEWKQRANGKEIISFAMLSEADISVNRIAEKIEIKNNQFYQQYDVITPIGHVSIKLSLAGAHNVMNSLSAIAVAIGLDCTLAEIKQGLESIRPVKGRLCPMFDEQGVCWIDDTYNANPTSSQAALDVLSRCDGERIFVLGDMAELGDDSVKLHEKIGCQAKKQGIQTMFAIGKDSQYAIEQFGENGKHFDVINELIESLDNQLKSPMTILVKGSRSQKMERVINYFNK
ncbi:MAG: UDP-N-acetylmuramoyl-tripeptide--D-alanyl-D-alanine ligase [Methylococcales bacterium]|nr:UDP-N-acetylmuramoyl-tripeptide--D-alanyl-D-alanine ligase [Methylococcales bacterium]